MLSAHLLLVAALVGLAACQGSKPPAASSSGSGSATEPGGIGAIAGPAGGSAGAALGPRGKPDLDAAASSLMLPPPAATVPAAELAADQTCGPLATADFAPGDISLLNDRIRVRFLPGTQPAGTSETAKAQVTVGGVTAFVGARELFLAGDSAFPQRATKQASFGGDSDPVQIPGRDGVRIFAGLTKAAPTAPASAPVDLAHGWFVDADHHVIDVAVFASGVTAENLAACRRFAQKTLATVGVGPRKLVYGSTAPVVTKVEYASFEYQLPPGWTLASSWGTQDAARLVFRKRGAYPDEFTELQLALDAHPGSWAVDGATEGTQAGTLLGLPVTWTLTTSDLRGAWTVSKDRVKRDHAAAAILAADVPARDEALRFAASIVAK